MDRERELKVTSSQPSGPNHHFIPRFLQRGFASGKRGKNPFVFYFQRDESVTERQINSVGSDEYFYGHPSESSVDEQLKVQENKFGLLVSELRNKKATENISAAYMPELFAHMAVRTKNIRVGFTSAAKNLIDCMASVYDTSEGRACLQRRIQESVADKVEKQLQEEPYSSLLAQLDPQLRSQLKAQLEANLKGMDLASEFRSKFRQITPMLDFLKIAEDSHVKALAKLENAVPPRIESLRILRWSLIVKPASTFILGDIAVMAQHSCDGLLESPLKESDPPHAIFLPISDRHLLHGTRAELSTDVDSEMINQASAELSVDFFIASQNTERGKYYLPRIGKRSGLLTADELAEITREIV